MKNIMNLQDPGSAPIFLLLLTAVIFLRYFLFAGFAWVTVHRRKSAELAHKRIQNRAPDKKAVRNEFLWSVSTVVIFALFGLGLVWLKSKGYTRMYSEFSEYGIGYFLFSVVVLIFAHDTYFYWMHRFMHLPVIYKAVHKVHHRSVNPSPWAAFSFHPLEAVLETAIVPIMAFLMPLHSTALLVFATLSMAMNVLGHLGYELFPASFSRFGIRVLNSATHHNLHHARNRSNYGLYFNFWDRWMGTNHEKYESLFAEISSRQKPAADSALPAAPESAETAA